MASIWEKAKAGGELTVLYTSTATLFCSRSVVELEMIVWRCLVVMVKTGGFEIDIVRRKKSRRCKKVAGGRAGTHIRSLSLPKKLDGDTQGAAAATSRTAKRTKLKAEIMALTRDINKGKSEFGILAYELVVGGDLAGAQKVAFEKKVKIDQWKNAITAKRAEIQRLNEEALKAGETVPPPTKSEFGGDDDPDGEVVI